MLISVFEALYQQNLHNTSKDSKSCILLVPESYGVISSRIDAVIYDVLGVLYTYQNDDAGTATFEQATVVRTSCLFHNIMKPWHHCYYSYLLHRKEIQQVREWLKHVLGDGDIGKKTICNPQAKLLLQYFFCALITLYHCMLMF